MGNKLARRRTHIDDRYTRPQGLYQHKDVDHKKLRRLIVDSKLAPCYPGAEDATIDLDECPICFLHYPSLNRSKCCTKGICTECFLQVKSPNTARPTQCPFCKTPNYAVEYRGAKTQEEKGVEQAEEQKVIEAKIRIRRQQEIQDEEARLQRQEQVSSEETPRGDVQESEQAPLPVPAFPVFSGSTVADDRPSEQVSAPERSWNAWTNVDSTAVGYPQPDFFAFPSRSGSESPWHRGSQRDFNRHNQLSSSSALSTRNPASFSLRRRGAWSNSSSGEVGGQAGAGSGYHPYNRDEDFDLDLEDIMVMEAIWLSIQEQGSQRPPVENVTEAAFPSPLNTVQYEQDTPPLDFSGSRSRRGSVTGGFASAIAALAERQVTGSTTSEQPSQSDSESSDSAAVFNSGDVPAPGETEFVEEEIRVVSGTEDGCEKKKMNKLDGSIQKDDPNAGEEAPASESETTATTGSITNNIININTNNNNNNNLSSNNSNGNLTTWMRQGSVEGSSDVLLDQGSEAVEVGTSFCSSIPSASELPWEAPDMADDTGATPGCTNPPPEMIPESFEEQMMLAMALSLAEAQAQAQAKRGFSKP